MPLDLLPYGEFNPQNVRFFIFTKVVNEHLLQEMLDIIIIYLLNNDEESKKIYK